MNQGLENVSVAIKINIDNKKLQASMTLSLVKSLEKKKVKKAAIDLFKQITDRLTSLIDTDNFKKKYDFEWFKV